MLMSIRCFELLDLGLLLWAVLAALRTNVDGPFGFELLGLVLPWWLQGGGGVSLEHTGAFATAQRSGRNCKWRLGTQMPLPT